MSSNDSRAPLDDVVIENCLKLARNLNDAMAEYPGVTPSVALERFKAAHPSRYEGLPSDPRKYIDDAIARSKAEFPGMFDDYVPDPPERLGELIETVNEKLKSYREETGHSTKDTNPNGDAVLGGQASASEVPARKPGHGRDSAEYLKARKAFEEAVASFEKKHGAVFHGKASAFELPARKPGHGHDSAEYLEARKIVEEKVAFLEKEGAIPTGLWPQGKHLGGAARGGIPSISEELARKLGHEYGSAEFLKARKESEEKLAAHEKKYAAGRHAVRTGDAVLDGKGSVSEARARKPDGSRGPVSWNPAPNTAALVQGFAQKLSTLEKRNSFDDIPTRDPVEHWNSSESSKGAFWRRLGENAYRTGGAARGGKPSASPASKAVHMKKDTDPNGGAILDRKGGAPETPATKAVHMKKDTDPNGGAILNRKGSAPETPAGTEVCMSEDFPGLLQLPATARALKEACRQVDECLDLCFSVPNSKEALRRLNAAFAELEKCTHRAMDESDNYLEETITGMKKVMAYSKERKGNGVFSERLKDVGLNRKSAQIVIGRIERTRKSTRKYYEKMIEDARKLRADLGGDAGALKLHDCLKAPTVKAPAAKAPAAEAPAAEAPAAEAPAVKAPAREAGRNGRIGKATSEAKDLARRTTGLLALPLTRMELQARAMEELALSTEGAADLEPAPLQMKWPSQIDPVQRAMAESVPAEQASSQTPPDDPFDDSLECSSIESAEVD